MSNEIDAASRTPRPPRGGLALRGALVTGLALLVGFGVLYGIKRPGKEAGAGACAAKDDAQGRLDPLIHGEVAGLVLAKPPAALSDLKFMGDAGAPKTLADFRGKTVLLNLWATWCIPCRKEMPALDRLQAALGGPDFQVVAVNVDTARLDRPKQFLAEVGATHLPFYADPSADILQSLRQNGPVLGLPTTILVDRNGCTLATLAGPADWSSEDAKRVIAAARS